MKHEKHEFLLAYVLLCSIGLAYLGSFLLPWFLLSPRTADATVDLMGEIRDDAEMIRFGKRSRLPKPQFGVLPSGPPEPITGLDAYEFLFERLKGGCFVGLAHPISWVGCALLIFRRWRAATVAGCLALAFAHNTAFVFQPRVGPWIAPQAGYYLWFGSMALLASAVLWRNCFRGKSQTANGEQPQQLAAQQRRLAAQVADLRQQIEDLTNQHAADFFAQPEGRSGGPR